MMLRSVGVLSVGKLLGTMYAVIGLIFGGILALMAMAGVAMQPANANAPVIPMFFGAGAVILFPVMYGVAGFIGGIICAAIYNVIAGMVGGIEVNFESNTTPM